MLNENLAKGVGEEEVTIDENITLPYTRNYIFGGSLNITNVNLNEGDLINGFEVIIMNENGAVVSSRIKNITIINYA